ncbi:unnamed protein product [Leuciscus chuanchicus]
MAHFSWEIDCGGRRGSSWLNDKNLILQDDTGVEVDEDVFTDVLEEKSHDILWRVVDQDSGTWGKEHYLLREIHLKLVILERTPTLSTRCMDTHTHTPYPTVLCAPAPVPRNIRYPASGMEFLTSVTRASRSSSVHVLYKALTDTLYSFFLLISAARDTPSKFAIDWVGSPSSMRWVRLVAEIETSMSWFQLHCNRNLLQCLHTPQTLYKAAQICKSYHDIF